MRAHRPGSARAGILALFSATSRSPRGVRPTRPAANQPRRRMADGVPGNWQRCVTWALRSNCGLSSTPCCQCRPALGFDHHDRLLASVIHRRARLVSNRGVGRQSHRLVLFARSLHLFAQFPMSSTFNANMYFFFFCFQLRNTKAVKALFVTANCAANIKWIGANSPG